MATQGRYVSEIVSRLSSQSEPKEGPRRVSVTSPERSLSPWSPGGSREDLKSPTGKGRRSPWDPGRSASLDSRGGNSSYLRTRRVPWSPTGDDSDSQESTSSRKSNPWVTQLRSTKDLDKDSSVKRSQSIDYGPGGKKKVATDQDSFPFGRKYIARDRDKDGSNAPRRTVSLRSGSAVNDARRAFFSPPRDREMEESIVSAFSPTKQTIGTARPRSPYRPSSLVKHRTHEDRGREKMKSPKEHSGSVTQTAPQTHLSASLGSRSQESRISPDDSTRQKSRLSQQMLRGTRNEPQHKTEKLEPQIEWRDSPPKDESNQSSESYHRRALMSPVRDLMSVSEVSEASSTEDMVSSTVSQDSWVSNGTNQSNYSSQPSTYSRPSSSSYSRPSSYCESYEERIFTPDRPFSPGQYTTQGSQSSLDRPRSQTGSTGSRSSQGSLNRSSQGSIERSHQGSLEQSQSNQGSLERSQSSLTSTEKPKSNQSSLERPVSGDSYSSRDRHLSPDRSSSKSNYSRPSSGNSFKGQPDNQGQQGNPNPVASDSDSEANGDEFHEGLILPPVLIQLKKILEQYPDDSQILKELIQNAEDAGASRVKFLHDRRTYGTNPRGLHHPKLAQYQGPALYTHWDKPLDDVGIFRFQHLLIPQEILNNDEYGPALYAFNDALFEEDDWKGIRMLSQSVKQQDPFKVGYFGMGFKSVFHLTDMPSVLSGERLGMIDPHQKVFHNTTFSWNISKQQDLLRSQHDQLDPYIGTFDCTRDTFTREGFYNGTLFRFPLRRQASPLSDNIYGPERLQRLFESFEEDAHLTLLFLRHLESIELYERDERSVRPKFLFRVQISDSCLEDVKEKRKDFLQRVRNGRWMDKAIVATYPVTIETVKKEKSGEVHKTYTWLVTNYYSGGRASAIFRKLHQDIDLSFPPWVGVAMPVDVKGTSELNEEDGHVFCFLPLPPDRVVPTGLPVHINGFFALEQNRKYIKWPNVRQRRDDLMDKHLLWNQCLIQEALPYAYAHLLLTAIDYHRDGFKLGISVDLVYRAFPDFNQVDRRWEGMLVPLYSELMKHKIVFTSVDGGHWLEPKSAIFNTLEENEATSEVILQVLALNQAHVANVPKHVLYAIRSCCHVNINKITPLMVSGALRKIQDKASFTWDEKMALLKFLMKQNKYELLDGLQLLPLANGGFTSFHANPRRAEKFIFIPTNEHPQDILPNIKDDLLDAEIEKETLECLTKAAMRGYTQLKVLTKDVIAQLLLQSLPASWKGAQRVTWDPEQFGQPPKEWLKNIWMYLQRNFTRDLSAFEPLPLIPIEEGATTDLVQLYATCGVIMRHMDGLSLDEDVERILVKLGVNVVDDLPLFVKNHPLVTEMYVFSPSYIGVLKTLNRVSEGLGLELFLAKMTSQTTADEKRRLRSLFSKMSLFDLQLRPELQRILFQIPLLETLEGSGGFKESRFVCATEVSLAAPNETLPVNISQSLIKIDSADASNLAQLLKVRRLTVIELLREIVFPDIEGAYYAPEDIEKCMLYVLKHYYAFLEKDSSIESTLRSLPFLSRKGLLLTTERFYDPDHALLQKMFQGEENFPVGVYADQSIISILRNIGLRGLDDVETEDLYETARLIHHCNDPDSVITVSDAAVKSDALMEYLVLYPKSLFQECNNTIVKDAIADLCWVRPMNTRPSFYPENLKWCESKKAFEKASLLKNLHYASIVGSVLHIVPVEPGSELGEVYGWNEPPQLKHIVDHMIHVVKSYEPSQKAKFMDLATKVYNELSKYDAEVILEAFTKAGIVDWLWHGEGFTTPGNVVINTPFMDMRPWVYSIPNEISSHAQLFRNCGVKESCEIVDVLMMIKRHYEMDGKQVDPKYTKRDLHICVSILNELKSHVTEEELIKMENVLVLPILTRNENTIKMATLPNCTYCDSEWLRQGYDLADLMSEDEEILLVHPNVPTSTSEALGVPTLMSRMLDADELDFSFGQSDSLTHRLNTLLQEYTDGFAVPKELVQNADDAGATEVRFLYDERENEDAQSCLIDEGMRECQGPALWAYNDAVFTDDDFENITKLSGATKEMKTEMIGRFGLGFNAVYNITDVPSFISRHNVVIFDPHTTHLGRSIKNKSRPGIKIDMRKHRRKLRRLGNQFKPFNDIFSCDLRPDTRMESFNATLFRFPLRTRSQAIRSEVCQRHYDDKEMRSLLNMLFKGAEHLLLFTQNVIRVTVYHIPRGGTPANMTEVFKVTKAPIKVIRELGVDITLSPSAQRVEPHVKDFIRQCNILKASKEALQYVKSGTPVDHLIVPSTSMILNLSCKMSRASEKIFGSSEYDQNRPWIVTNHFGTGKALRMALQEENMLPIGGVAVPLRFTGTEGIYMPEPITQVEDADAHHGTIFSYLPMPIHSGLPVHINGSFSVTSNRRHLCERNEDDKFDLRAIWNEALLNDSVCRAYLIMLQDLSSFLEPKTFISLWPDSRYVQSNVNELFTNFFKTLSTEDSPFALYSDGQRWGLLTDAVFLTPELRTSSVGDIIMKIFSTHMCESNKILVDLPVNIKRSFEAAKCDKALDERSYDLARFLEAQLLPNILQVKEELRDPVVLYSLRNGTDEIKALLKEHPCIPVSPAGDLRMPGALIDPSSELAALYSPEDARFPHGHRTYASKEILPLLTELGMARDDIPWEDLLERAKSIRKVEYPIARRRIYNLLYFLEQKLSKMKASKIEVEEFFREQFLQTPFLPIMSKPKNFSKKWKGQDFEEETLLTSSELYPAKCMPLVCSVHPVLDESVLPSAVDHVRDFLQLSNKYVSLGDVLEQINTVIYTGNDTTDREILAELQRVSYVIYDYLEDLVKKDKNAQARIRDDLSSKPFLFVQNAFLQPKHMAMNFSHPCVPYLFSVPEHMKQHYPNLLQTVGVRDHFDPRDYVEALQAMHEQYQNNPLDKDTVRLALRLVNYLNDSISDHNQTLDDVLREFGEIYIPDAESVLRAATELCYNEPECQWLPTDQVTKLSHPLIPYAISKQLGVNTRRQEVLKKHSRGIPFGQREGLTNRLKRILASYPCDKEILKELLQNSDDAGSADIHFIKDPRFHPIERVFEESWRPLQGPSLCVYNDTVFTEEDIEGIQRLGEGSKSNDPNKTGQYGVGFNCVYHLTDAPSFMTAVPGSGQNLCVFDPHAKYVPGSTAEVPGRRYDDVLELRTIFTDVFSCYLGDKFDLNSATMFRFPLRTKEMSRDSELSDTPFTLEMLTTLLSKFKQEVFDCLLFVNNVKSVSISDIDKVTNRLTNTYTVTSEISSDDQDKRYAFHQALKEMSEKIRDGDKDVWDVMEKEVTYTLKLQDNRGYWEKWLVVQRLGFEEGTVLPPSLYDAFRNKELALLPRGGVAAMLDASDMKRADRYKRAFCFLPLPLRTDLPVQINGHFALEHEARRNLWLDEESGYKTDWNMMIIKKVIARAYVTLLKTIPSHLGTLRVGEDTSFFSVCDDRVPDIDFYSGLFPKFNTTYPYWKALTKEVYRVIDSSKADVLPVLKLQPMAVTTEKTLDESAFMNEDWSEVEVEWCSTGQGAIKPYFDNLDETFTDEDDLNNTSFMSRSNRMSSTPKKKPRKEILRRILLRCGLKVIQLPMEIFDNFRKATVSVEVISPSAVIAFFKTHNLPGTTCNVGGMPIAIANTQFRTEKILEVVMQYCAKDKNYFLSQLEGLPFQLCEDDQLRVYSCDDPLYLSSFHGLLPDCGAMFVHHSLVKSVFSEIDPDQYMVFMRLDIPALAGLLSNVIRDSLYKNGKAHLPWNYAREKIPNKKWIKIFWSYVRTELNRLMELNEVGDLAVMDMLRKFLRPLSDWCFIPAFIPPAGTKHNTSRTLYDSLEREPEEQYLVPIGMADTVIDFTYTSIMSAGVREALRSLGIPELHARMLDGMASLSSSSSSANATATGNLPAGVVFNNNSDLVRKLVASLENPTGVLRVLDYTIRSKHGVVALKSEDSHSILKYFNDSVDGWVKDEEAIKILRKLPLFLTVKGDVINLGEKRVYILPSDVPTNDMNLWEKEEGIVFLRKNKTLSALHSALNCEALTTTEMYTNFIFKSFHLLNPPARVAHLQFLKDIKLNQLQSDEKDQLITGLKSLEFLEDARGILRPASHYYDPYQPVFKVLLAASPSAFPPPPFREFKWLDFMRLIGLKHKVTTDMFVEFAQDIAKEAVTVQTEATFNKARTLLTQLFKRENLATEGLLEKIADIPFIPAVKISVMLQNIYPQYCFEGGRKTYIQFRHSVPEDKEHLIWSSSHLIPDWANPYKLTMNDVTIKYDPSNPLSNFKEYKHKICTQLGVLEEPTIDKVIEHMKHICLDQPRVEDDVKAFVKIEVMKNIYKFLQQYATDDDFAANELRDTPCVMVDSGHLMVKPCQVVMNLFEEDQIIPYLYKAPTELGEFKKLFTYLGASLNATVDQYAMVLSNIYHVTRGQKMHPNEMMAAFKCVQGLFNTLEKHPNDPVDENVLYLPSKFGTLLDAKDLVFNDDPCFTDRIKTFNRPFLVDLFECGVHASSFDDLIKLLHGHLQPVMLTDLVKEVLEESSRETLVSHGIAEKLRMQLNSVAFSQGVVRLIRHENRRSGQKMYSDVLNSIQSRLKKIKVYGVKCVKTYLRYEGKLIPHSEMECECFVDQTDDEEEGEDGSKEQTWNIYIDSSASLSEELLVSVAEVVNRIVGGYLRNSVHYLQPILSCQPHSITKVLDRLKIRPDHLHSSGPDFKAPTLPHPGSFIPIEDHHLLKQDFEDFEPGEYVGYELDDNLSGSPTVIYAVILDRILEETSRGDEIVFKRKYKINAGDDRKPVTALATDLYKFHRLEDGMMSKRTRERSKPRDEKQNTFQSGVGSGFTSASRRPSRAEKFSSFRRSGFENTRRRFASPGGSLSRDEEDAGSQDRSGRQTPLSPERKPEERKPEPPPRKQEPKKETPKPEQPKKPATRPTTTKPEKKPEEKKPEPKKQDEKESPKDESKPEPRLFRGKGFKYTRPESPRMERKAHGRPQTPDQRPETPDSRPGTPDATPPPRRRRHGYTIPEEPEVEDMGADTEDGKKSAYDYIRASRTKPGNESTTGPRIGTFARFSTRRKINQTRSRTPESDKPTEGQRSGRERPRSADWSEAVPDDGSGAPPERPASAAAGDSGDTKNDPEYIRRIARERAKQWWWGGDRPESAPPDYEHTYDSSHQTTTPPEESSGYNDIPKTEKPQESQSSFRDSYQSGSGPGSTGYTNTSPPGAGGSYSGTSNTGGYSDFTNGSSNTGYTGATPGGSNTGYAPGGSNTGYTPSGSSTGYAPGGSSTGYAPGGSSTGYTPGGSSTGPSTDNTKEESGYKSRYFGSSSSSRPSASTSKPAPSEPSRPEPKIPDPEEGKTQDEIMEEISDALEEAWKLPEGQRKKIIKRILLKWHPDKNIGNEQFATEITQHIQVEIVRLEQGLPRGGAGAQGSSFFSSGNPFAGSADFQRNFQNAYQYFYEQMNQRAKEHKKNRERYQDNFSKTYGSKKEEFKSKFDVPPSFSKTNPQPTQASRFFRQAQEDLKAADNDYNGPAPAFEWVCMKAHQAAEKALKAAQFMVDAVSSFSHDLPTLAATMDDNTIRTLAIRLQSIVGDANKFYNPDPIDFVVIPHEEFTREKALNSTIIATEILEKVRIMMGLEKL